MSQAEYADKDDIRRLDSRMDRLEDRMERGFAEVRAAMDRLGANQIRIALVLAGLIAAFGTFS